jgi:predicted ATPase
VIQSVHIRNFRCLRDVDFTLSPLTALVGPNGSGKSTVLAALNPGLQFDWSMCWRHERSLEIGVAFRLPDKTLEWAMTPTGRRLVITTPFGYQFLRLDLDKMREAIELTRMPKLDWKGAQLANAFGTLTRKQQAELAEQLCSLVPTFSDVDLVPVGSGNHTLRFHDRWDPSVHYSPSEVSDGTMLVLAFLLIQHQQDVPDLLAIEEPERGLHPYLLGELVAFLRKLAAGEIGARPIQIVLATQSADLLDHLRPDEVRFLDRDTEDGSVRVEAVDTGADGWERAFAEYRNSLGSAWLAGSLGGVPG